MASLREQLNQEAEIKKMQAERTATDGSIIVDEDYTLTDLEEYVVNKIHEGKLDFLLENRSKLVNLLLETEDNCYDTKNTSGDTLFLTMYLNYYFNNIEPYMFCDKLGDSFSEYDLKRLCEDNKEFVLIQSPVSTKSPYDMLRNAIICRKNNEDIFRSKYENSIVDTEILEKIAAKLFEKPIKAIKSFINRKQITSLQYKYSSSISFDMYMEANRIKIYKQLKSLLQDELKNLSNKENLTNIFLIPTSSSPELILIRANFMCSFSIYEKDGFLSIGTIRYSVLSKDDTILIETGDSTTINMDATVSPVYTKKTSVIGNALIGTAVAGVAGGYVGTLLATDANRKRQEQINSYKPLMIDIKLPKLEITIRLKRMKDIIYLKVDKALYENMDIEQLLLVISEAKTDKACFEGELIKEFILDSDPREYYSEENFKVYAKQKKESLKNDNRFPVIVDKETEIQKNIKDSESKYDKDINNLQQDYDVKVNACKEQVINIKNKIDSLGIFKMKKKKELKNELQVVEAEMNTLKKSYEYDVAKAKAKFRMEIQNIESQKNELEMIEEVLLYKVGILEAQNRLY